MVEPLEEASLSMDELNRFMVCCTAATDSIPSHSQARGVEASPSLSINFSTTRGDLYSSSTSLPPPVAVTRVETYSTTSTSNININSSNSSHNASASLSSVAMTSVASSGPLVSGSVPQSLSQPMIVESRANSQPAIPISAAHSNVSQAGTAASNKTKVSKGDMMKADWQRFVSFTRLCLIQLKDKKG